MEAIDEGRIITNRGLDSCGDQRVNVGDFSRSPSAQTPVAVVGDAMGRVAESITLEVPGWGWALRAVRGKCEKGQLVWGGVQVSCTALPWAEAVDDRSNDGSLAPPMVHDPPEDGGAARIAGETAPGTAPD